ncbi:hypothetical protein A2U01_0053114 [Trifolium medium]|uniref:Uncharacterized protein n=1 Tax=Trifolium medium TaxID=97028 RepID=A0A392R736_9FABA|nr:hypothetical protein [Trifolium medium]
MPPPSQIGFFNHHRCNAGGRTDDGGGGVSHLWWNDGEMEIVWERGQERITHERIQILNWEIIL